jgi:hypothetical protein
MSKTTKSPLAPNVRWPDPDTRYDIVAKAEGDGAPTRSDFREMLVIDYVEQPSEN